MTKQFLGKILYMGSVDTRKYRYVARNVTGANEQHIEIQRLRLSLLDTTAALDSWETVAKVR